MTKKDYQLIADAVNRTRIAMSIESNIIKRQAKHQALSLLITDLGATLKHDNPAFDQQKFAQACGVVA